MFPEICKIGPFTVYSYGLMLVLAFGTSYFLAARQARRQGVSGAILFDFLFTCFVFGIIGSRLFYVLENLAYYTENPLEMIMLQRGGLSWFGGFSLGLIAGAIFMRVKKLPVLKFLDLAAPFIALAQAIGRVGCLLNGCCFGKASAAAGIYFPVHDAILIPTQLYSSLGLLLIFIILRFMQEKPHSAGSIFLTYLLLYSSARFLIESARADNQIIYLGLTLFQFISIGIFICALIWLILLKRAGD